MKVKLLEAQECFNFQKHKSSILLQELCKYSTLYDILNENLGYYFNQENQYSSIMTSNEDSMEACPSFMKAATLQIPNDLQGSGNQTSGNQVSP